MCFVTFEGCDGSGKSTQVALLVQRLKNAGINCIQTKEPGGTPLAQEIRYLLLKSEIKDPATEFALLSAARRDHVQNVIELALKNNTIVVCDRFLDSSLVYQGIRKGLNLELMLDVHKKLVGTLEPTITFLLNLEPETIVSRLKNNLGREINHYDRQHINFHKTIQEGFLLLAKKFPQRICVIDASKNIELIAQEIFTILNSLLTKLYKKKYIGTVNFLK